MKGVLIRSENLFKFLKFVWKFATSIWYYFQSELLADVLFKCFWLMFCSNAFGLSFFLLMLIHFIVENFALYLLVPNLLDTNLYS